MGNSRNRNLSLNSEDSVLIFDVETTGKEPERDQIVELSVQTDLLDTTKSETWRIRPSIPISPGAQAVHGITIDDLLECPKFSELAEDIRVFFERATILIAYNIRFDLTVVQSEFRRAKKKEIDLSGKFIVDPYRLWTRMEPRDLAHAHKRFVGSELKRAHRAAADVAATGRVLSGMVKAFRLPAGDWEKIAEICRFDERPWIGPSKHVQWKEGVPVIAFGKHYGKPVVELVKEEKGEYLNWMIGRDFPEHVKDIARRAMECSPDNFQAWVVKQFGEAPE